ncbi:integral membrane amino acid permease [Cryptosporidium bovis]|uniref:integral membrane amino acid permease n=1 Tax=Cryptosporidium bovis TaxID=310047 RepID=UPI003519DA9F|nr:integral membrane amino acid permease [Cryptosporidium bovis]
MKNLKEKENYSLSSLVFVSFFTVSGGSYGSEVVLPVIGVRNFTYIQISICILYAIPLILTYDLMCNSFPGNSGPKDWCRVMLGPFSGHFVDVLYMFMEIGMLLSFVGIASAYINSFLGSMKNGLLSQGSQIIISLTVFALIIAISLSLSQFEDYTKIMFIIVIFPLLILVIFTFTKIPINSWLHIDKLEPDKVNWIIGLQYVMWLNCGYENLFSRNSNSEGGIVNDNIRLKLPLILNVILVSFIYIIPLWCGCCILNHFNKDNHSFELGNFFTLSGFLVGGNLLSSLVTISACISSIGCITFDVSSVSQFIINKWLKTYNLQHRNMYFSQETLISLGVVIFCSILTLFVDQQHFAAGASTLYGFITLIVIVSFLKFIWALDIKDEYLYVKSESHLPLTQRKIQIINQDTCYVPYTQTFIDSLYFGNISLKFKQILHTIIIIPTILFVSVIFFTSSSLLYIIFIIASFLVAYISFVSDESNDRNYINNVKINRLK